MPQQALLAAIAKFRSNVAGNLLMGRQQDALVSFIHQDKYDQTYRGNMFAGASQTAATTSAGLATTYTGLCLSNPAGSGINVAIRNVAGQFIVAPASVTGFNLITGWAAGGVTVHTTPVTPFSQFIGGAGTLANNGFTTNPVPAAKVDAACTLVGTPVYTRPLAVPVTATNLISFFVDLLEGIILPPGGYAAIGTTIAGPAAGFLGSFEWSEYPV
jgi:hypothetical protein